ncbi:hypothetical protein GALMADRAFT_246963 [Galerina marginata CBS 339.88]|uniref:F-box domain-containing protein n=1 Tax=Galerina marginata (strain CBS 339.88) TaxID=685588 RepID=A0A067T2M7_GALM3|nr:hypothetical protein GALMADRAFT_246963 [Galerina marginata CBS 339.88]
MVSPLMNPLNTTLQRQSPLGFHLPQDILWYTFYFVVQPSTDRTRSVFGRSALNNLRRLSQVCASWRELLLASSSLWGMALELNQLSQKTCHWRNEVLRRTGDSLLDIHCHICTKDIGVLEQFVKFLLDEHWPRIRSLDIDLNKANSTTKGEEFVRETIDAFQKPAINLKSFRVNLDIHSVKMFTLKLFADQAPLLQEFWVHSFRVHPRRPWFYNLRVLHITCLWTAHELLNTLASMPLLEVLVFNEDHDYGGTMLDPPVVNKDSLARAVLPQLKELKVDMGTSLAKHLAVLERLIPAPGLHFGLTSGPLGPTPADLVAFQRVIGSYLQLAFKNELPRDLQVVMTEDYILVYLSKDSGGFKLELEFDHDVPDITILLEPITSISLEYSTKLTISIRGIAPAATDSALSRILLSSPSIKELHVTSYGLNLLLSLSTSPDNTLFPVLELLRLDGLQEVRPVLDFLSRRYIQEAPIKCLDLCQYQRAGSCDFHSLEQFSGLKVRWTGTGGSTEEYTCGSGNAQVLDFTHSFPEP